MPGISQTTEVRLTVEQAEIIWRDLETLPVLIEENEIMQQQILSLRAANYELHQASEAAQNEAGAQRAIAGIKAEQVDACHAELRRADKVAKTKLWKTRAIAAGGWLLAGVFGYLTVTN